MTTLDELRARAAAALKDKPKGDGRHKPDAILGRRFGRLVVVARSHSIAGHTYYDCACDCGSTTTVQSASLAYGKTKSCGCLRREIGAVRGERKAVSARLVLEAEKKGGAP